MELIEKPNLDAVNYLNSIQYKTFKDDCLHSAELKQGTKPSEKDLKTWFNILKQFCKTNIKTKGITKRIYSYSQTTPAGQGGRLFCGGSLQGIWSVYRGLLMRGVGTDIDMKNCHPVLLRYICKLHDIRCPELEYYINHRDDCLAEFPTKEAGKNAYLIATNNDVVLRGKDLPRQIKKYDKEMKDIQKKLVALSDYKNLQEAIPDYKLSKNYNGSVINRILCYYENIALQHAIHVINSRGIEIAILMFDGLMVYGDFYNDETLLNEITAYVEQQMVGLKMEWAYKAHDKTLNIPDDFDNSVLEKEGVCSDLEASQKLYKLYPHWVYCLESLYVFDDEIGLWTDCPVVQNKIINRFTDELHVMVMGKDEMIKTLKSYGNTTNLQKLMIEQLKTLCIDNNWIRRTQDSSLKKLLFNNGYYDLQEGKFYDKKTYSFNPDIVFTGKIHHDYDQKAIDVEYVESIKKRFFTDPLGEDVGSYMIYLLARGLGGDRLKNVLFGLGNTNCGKTILTTAIMLSCGDYVGSFNAENLVYNNSSNDEAQKMRWCMLLCKKRIIFSNEMKNTTEINGNMLKKISSGGDTLIGRTHGGTETEFTTHFLPVCFANDIPKIKPLDDAVNERLRIISFEKQFVDEPENEFELRKDTNICEEIKTIEFQKAFVGLLISNYLLYHELQPEMPLQVINSKKEWTDKTETDPMTMFLDEFEITNDIKDFIESKYMKNWLADKKVGISPEKFAKDLKKYCVRNGMDKVINKVKKINGKNRQCWFGMKPFSYNPEMEVEEEEDIEIVD